MLTTETTAGERFARAFLAKDWDGVATLLDPQVDFRGLTPGRAWEASTAEDLIQQVLSKWIEPSDDVHEVIDVATDRIADRWRVAYRFRVRNPGGDFVCEQTAYYDTDGERIIKLRVLCSASSRPPTEAERPCPQHGYSVMPIDADVAASVLIDAWRHLFSSMHDSVCGRW